MDEIWLRAPGAGPKRAGYTSRQAAEHVQVFVLRFKISTAFVEAAKGTSKGSGDHSPTTFQPPCQKGEETREQKARKPPSTEQFLRRNDTSSPDLVLLK